MANRFTSALSLHKKLSFPIRISSVNVKISFTEEILHENLHFLCSVSFRFSGCAAAKSLDIFFAKTGKYID